MLIMKRGFFLHQLRGRTYITTNQGVKGVNFLYPQRSINNREIWSKAPQRSGNKGGAFPPLSKTLGLKSDLHII